MSENCSFTYDEIFRHMTPDQILEANSALDIVIEQQEKSMKKK